MELIDDCKEAISLIEDLETVSFEIGVFEEDSGKEETASIINLDGTVTNIQLTLGEIMYFTEYGTISVPGKNLLKNIIDLLMEKLNDYLQDITTRILEGNVTSSSELLSYMEIWLTEINYDIIPRAFNNTVATLNNINNIIEKEDSNYIYDISKLSRYIKCKIHYSF